MVELCDKISIVPAEEVAAKDAKTYVDHIYDQVCEAMHAAVEYCRPTGKKAVIVIRIRSGGGTRIA